MKISQILHFQIGWDAAKAAIEAIGAALKGDAKHADVAEGIVSNLKQVASDAITTADSAAGPLLAVGAEIVEGAFDKAAAAYIGPTGQQLVSPLVHDGIDKIEATLVAAIHARSVALKAMLVAPPATIALAAPASPPAP